MRNNQFATVKKGASQSPLLLRRSVTWEEWEAGRATRRALAMKITRGKILRRGKGKPRKDVFLRCLNGGQRGLPFQPIKAPTDFRA